MRWHMKVLTPILSACLLLSACSTIEFDEIASAGASTAGATVGTALAGPAGGVVGGVAAGTATLVVTPKSAPVVDTAVVAEIMNPWQAFYVAWLGLLNHAFEIVIAIGVAVVAVPMIVSFAAGKIMPRRKEKEVMEENKVLKKLMDK